MKFLKGGLITVLIVVGVGIYLLESYVLKGVALYDGYAIPSEMVEHPTVQIPVPDEAENIMIYLKSDADWQINYRVTDPYGDVVKEGELTVGKAEVTFPADEEGVYNFRIDVPSGNYHEEIIKVSAWADDRRLFAGCH